MTGQIIGIKKIDFTDNAGKRIQGYKYWLAISEPIIDFGREVETIYWSIQRDGAPNKAHAINSEHKVEYTKNGKLRFSS